MEDESGDQDYLPESEEMQSPQSFLQIDSNRFFIETIPSIPCETASYPNNAISSGVTGHGDTFTESIDRSTIGQYSEIILPSSEIRERFTDLHAPIVSSETRSAQAVSSIGANTGDSVNPNHMRDSQRVEDLFSFINDGCGRDELTSTDSVKRDVKKARYENNYTESHESLMTGDSSLTEGRHEKSLINFNTPEATKEPPSIKGMDVFLPNVDPDHKAKSRNRRTPLASLVDSQNIEITPKSKDKSLHIADIKISNQNSESITYFGDNSRNSDLSSTMNRSRCGSFEDIPGTGHHIRNIYITKTSNYSKLIPNENQVQRNKTESRELVTDSRDSTTGDQAVQNLQTSLIDTQMFPSENKQLITHKQRNSKAIQQTTERGPNIRGDSGASSGESSDISSGDKEYTTTDNDSTGKPIKKGHLTKDTNTSSRVNENTIHVKELRKHSSLAPSREVTQRSLEPGSKRQKSKNNQPDIQVSVSSPDDGPKWEIQPIVSQKEIQQTTERGPNIRGDSGASSGESSDISSGDKEYTTTDNDSTGKAIKMGHITKDTNTSSRVNENTIHVKGLRKHSSYAERRSSSGPSREVTQRSLEPKPGSKRQKSKNNQPDIQVSVSSPDDGPKWEIQPIVSQKGSASVYPTGQSSISPHRQSGTEKVAFPKRVQDDNINVYVNVNVNMVQQKQSKKHKNNITDYTIQDTELKSIQVAESSDPTTDSSANSDKTQTDYSLSDHGDDFSSSDADSFNHPDYSEYQTKAYGAQQQQTNNLSVNYYNDRFRTTNNLGLRGLSPIPSMSYESDSTNRQIDTSSGDDGKITPTKGNFSDISSDTTLKDVLTDEESDDWKNAKDFRTTEKHLTWTQRKSSNKTKLKPTEEQTSDTNDSTELSTFGEYALLDNELGGKKRRRSQTTREEESYTSRPTVTRSYSQPEQYLMKKRQSAIDTMKAKKSVETQQHFEIIVEQNDRDSLYQRTRTMSERIRRASNIQSFTEYDYRLPLNVSGEFQADDNTERRMSGSSTMTRYGHSRSSWHPKSPYSNRVSRSSSVLSDGSRTGKGKRQLSVDIGEEWENVRGSRPRATSDVGSVSSSVFSYRSLRKQRVSIEMPFGKDTGAFGSSMPGQRRVDSTQESGAYADQVDTMPVDMLVSEEIDSPVAELKEERRDGARPIVEEPKPVVIEVEAVSDDHFTLPPEKRILLNNPYNSINQRFHSTLHCPCFIFFCFLCCAPAVYWMQRSDYEFDYGSEKRAKKFGYRATGLYIAGAIVSIVALSAAITVTYMLLKDELVPDPVI
ncbi:hypothetical protein SNE40_008223 [Patella caerulea]|uniref:Uncharacterized protein n=1 Tax=Patella caerulea TaxID=87958 RepID=A0AAN8K1G2_PATCE